MIKFFMHVFSGEFETQTDALAYGQWDYSADPDNPTCKFSKEFNSIQFESDYLEAVWGEERIDYLKSLLVDEADAILIDEKQRENDNTLVILMEIERNKNIKIPDSETGKLHYCGRYKGCFRD